MPERSRRSDGPKIYQGRVTGTALSIEQIDRCAKKKCPVRKWKRITGYQGNLSAKKRHMGEDNAPSFGQADPCLALPSARNFAGDGALKGNRDAGEIFAEGHDVLPGDGAG